MQTELIAAAAGAVLAPQFLGPVVSKIPGGAVGLVAAGAAGVYFASKMKSGGVVKGLAVGAAAGVAIIGIMSFVVKPTVTASA